MAEGTESEVARISGRTAVLGMKMAAGFVAMAGGIGLAMQGLIMMLGSQPSGGVMVLSVVALVFAAFMWPWGSEDA
jgi:hypothetical protein